MEDEVTQCFAVGKQAIAWTAYPSLLLLHSTCNKNGHIPILKVTEASHSVLL
jgi:hypothetical protein